MKIWDFWPHQSLSSRFLVAGVVGHTQNSDAWDCSYNQQNGCRNLTFLDRNEKEVKSRALLCLSRRMGSEILTE